MYQQIDVDRRRFLSAAAAAIAAARLAAVGASGTPSAGTNTFGELKQIDAGVLKIGYAELGPPHGGAVVLLHGWPYDIHSYLDVAPLLASAGYRVIVPYLRGYGTTRFLSSDALRNGQQSALAADVVALMDVLAIDRAIVAGFDWGARTANIVGALWPDRCKGMVSVSGYLIGSREANKMPLPPQAELEWWYQYYFATERGRAGYQKYRDEFARLIWRTASPSGDSPMRRSIAPRRRSYARKFAGKYTHRLLKGGIGHNLPQEAPEAFAQAVIDVDALTAGRRTQG